MRRSAQALVPVAFLIAAALAVAPAATASGPARRHPPSRFDAIAFQRQHGYLPLKGLATLERAKAHASAVVAAEHRASVARPQSGGPSIRESWDGISGATPPDANGAVGPNSYIEITNAGIGIYKRDGTTIATNSLFNLVGHSNIGDPMVLWDPGTHRFYYSLIGPNQTIDWGFTKDSKPSAIPGSFCGYESSFGFPSGSIPDYPKLGQTKGFLMDGINFYPSGSQVATEGDVLWMNKPQGTAPITTCPGANTFGSGIFHDLRNQDGSQAFTPVPAIQTDPSASGYVMAMSDIECPPICGKGTLLTTYRLKPSKADPKIPALSKPTSFMVGKYESPPDAPQLGTTDQLDTLDGRLTHAVSGLDPRVGQTTVWISHCVLGGAGSEVRWYEIVPGAGGSVVQSGAATDPNLYVFNGGISNDRTVNAKGKMAHGSAMVLGFDTSSATTYAAIQMVSKKGSNSQSAFVLVVQSSAPLDPPGSCGDLGCRWGDYSGATPDPAASLIATKGRVWLTNEYTSGDSTRPTRNWEATP